MPGHTSQSTIPPRPRRRDYVKAVGPGMVAGAADTDPTTVATLVIVGATTVYGLAWLTLLLLPVLAVVQALATRVGMVSGHDLHKAVTDGYGSRWSAVLLVSSLAVNVVTIAADLEAGAAAVGMVTGLDWAWFVTPLALAVLGLLVVGRYHQVQRVLKYVLLCLLAYGGGGGRGAGTPALDPGGSWRPRAVAALELGLHRRGVGALGHDTDHVHVRGQTVLHAEERRGRAWLSVGQFDAVAGTVLAVTVFWFILVASGATLGVHHLHADTAVQAAEALRPVAGPFASILFAIGPLGSAVVALPVIMASTAYATGSAFDWRRGLSLPVRKAPAFYAVLAAGALLGSVVALAGVSPIRLLFIASIIAGIATPVGLVLLVLVAGNVRLMRHQPAGRPLLNAGWGRGTPG